MEPDSVHCVIPGKGQSRQTLARDLGQPSSDHPAVAAQMLNKLAGIFHNAGEPPFTYLTYKSPVVILDQRATGGFI